MSDKDLLSQFWDWYTKDISYPLNNDERSWSGGANYYSSYESEKQAEDHSAEVKDLKIFFRDIVILIALSGLGYLIAYLART